MFAPISARFESSCSRNGMSEAETPTTAAGETSMKWTSSRRTLRISSLPVRTSTTSSRMRPSSSRGVVAGAM